MPENDQAREAFCFSVAKDQWPEGTQRGGLFFPLSQKKVIIIIRANCSSDLSTGPRQVVRGQPTKSHTDLTRTQRSLSY